MFIVIQGVHGKRDGDTMLLDSAAGHRRTFEVLTAFLSSGDDSVEIAGAGPCHLCPDWPTLQFFRMVKSDARLRTEELPGGVLQVSGRPELLARYVDEFRFDADEDGAHRHPEAALAVTSDIDPKSESVIIEVDSYADDPERWARDSRDEPP
jgi:hypothetical protein